MINIILKRENLRKYTERFSLLFYSSKSSRYSTFLLRSMLGTTLPL